MYLQYKDVTKFFSDSEKSEVPIDTPPTLVSASTLLNRKSIGGSATGTAVPKHVRTKLNLPHGNPLSPRAFCRLLYHFLFCM